MAYGIKYRHSYCNEYGVNSTVTILENGYSGSVKEIDAQEDPIVISQEGSDTDKFDTIRPSTASIGLIGNETFKLEELFTADERKYMVENHVGGAMGWRGFVIPNGFSHEWTGGTFPMEIIASDNLSTLKDFPFLNDNGTVIKGRLNHIDILLKCLNKLDIGIDLLTLTNIVRQGGVAGEDPLFINTTDAYTFLNTDVKEEGIDFYYDNPQNAFNCEDVVNSICRLYGAKLYQSKGQWRLKRVNVDYGASISGQTFHRYNTLGVKVGTVPYNEVITIPCNDYSGEKAQYSGARLAMSEVYKSAQSRYGFRYLVAGDKLPPIIRNQILSYPFPTPTPINFVPTNWDLKLYQVPPHNTLIRTINIAPELAPGGDFPPGDIIGGALRIYGGNRRSADSLRSSPVAGEMNIKKGDRLSLKFWHKTPIMSGALTFYLALRVILQTKNPDKAFNLVNSSVTISFDSLDTPRLHTPTWAETPAGAAAVAMTFIGKRTSISTSVYDWVQEYILSAAAPEDGTIFIEYAGIGFTADEPRPSFQDTGIFFQATVPSGNSQGVDSYTVDYSQKRFVLYSTEFKIGQLETGILIGGNGSPSGLIYTSEQSAKFTQRGSQISLVTSDVENKNAISGILTNGTFVDNWNDSRNPYPDYQPLGLMLSRDIMRQYKNVWRVIEEDIKANGLSFDTTIEFEERPGERYVIQRGAISQKFNRLIGCTLIQVSANPDTAFIGSETIDEDFSSSGGSGGGSGGGGSGGGGGSAPQDLQSVTDIGSETTNIITAKGVRAETLLEIPDHAPLAPDIEEDKNYLWIGSWGDGSPVPPSPGAQYFVDLLDVVKPLASGFIKFDQSTGLVHSDPNGGGGGGGDATEEWVEMNFEPKITKNTAFNKNFGTTNGTVARGDHSHNEYVKKSGDTMTGMLALPSLSLQKSMNDRVSRMRFDIAENGDINFASDEDLIINSRTGVGVRLIEDKHVLAVGSKSIAPIGGSVSLTNGSSELLGTSTNFLTYFKYGDKIYVDGNLFYVASVNSNTSITISINPITLSPYSWTGANLSELYYNQGWVGYIGTVGLTQGSSTVIGTGTLFLSDFKRGQRININDLWFYISSINSNTSLIISNDPIGLAPSNYTGITKSNLQYAGDDIISLSVSNNGNSEAIDLKVTESIGIPPVAPINPEAGINYLWIGDWGESAVIPPDPIPLSPLKFSSFIELEESESMTLEDEHSNAYIYCPEDGQVTVSNSFPVLGSATFQTQYGITLIFPAGHAVQWNGGSLTNGGSMTLYNSQNDFIIASLNRLSANRWSIDGM